MRIYIAGPMRGYDKFNFPAFDCARNSLKAFAHDPVSPADMDRAQFPDHDWTAPDTNTPDGFTVEDALRRDFAAILECDAIALLPGWERSTGANAELFVARTTGKRVFYLESDLVGYAYRLSDSDPYAITPEPDPFFEGTPFKAPLAENTETIEALRSALRADLVSLKPKIVHRFSGEEIRVTDPTTGGEKGQKLAQLGAIDPFALMELAKVAGFGASKYARYNFLKGYAWSLSYDALQRHLHAFWGGENWDEESGQPHLAHAAWHCLTLISFLSRGLGTDDRFKQAA